MNNITLKCLTILSITSLGLASADEKKDNCEKKGPDSERGVGVKGKGKGGKHKGAMVGKIFKNLDTDGSGSLSPEEFAEAPPMKEASEEEVEAAFAKKDLDGDGEIGKGEFAKTFGKGRRNGQGKGKRDDNENEV